VKRINLHPDRVHHRLENPGRVPSKSRSAVWDLPGEDDILQIRRQVWPVQLNNVKPKKGERSGSIKMRGITDLLARVFDVIMIVRVRSWPRKLFRRHLATWLLSGVRAFRSGVCACCVSRVRCVSVVARPLEERTRGQVALSWLVVQVCAMALMFPCTRIDFVSRLWFVYWSGMRGCDDRRPPGHHSVLGASASAGLNLQQVAVAGWANTARDRSQDRHGAGRGFSCNAPTTCSRHQDEHAGAGVRRS